MKHEIQDRDVCRLPNDMSIEALADLCWLLVRHGYKMNTCNEWKEQVRASYYILSDEDKRAHSNLFPDMRNVS